MAGGKVAARGGAARLLHVAGRLGLRSRRAVCVGLRSRRAAAAQPPRSCRIVCAAAAQPPRSRRVALCSRRVALRRRRVACAAAAQPPRSRRAAAA